MGDPRERPPVASPLTSDPASTRRSVFRVDQLDCPSEEQQLRRALDPLAEVTGLSFDLVARHVTIDHRLDDAAPLAAAIRHLGMRATPVEEPPTDAAPARALSKAAWLTTGLAGILAVGAEAVVIAGHEERSVLIGVMVAASIALGGRDTLRKGIRSIITRRLTMSLLMSVAVVGALIIGQWPEAAVVIWLFGVAELIEAVSLERARHAVRSLVDLTPETALVRTANGTVERPAGDVALDAIIVVRPGERIALDGIVTAGRSTVDQAPITGESFPVTKQLGDQVFAGTINQHGSIDVRVSAARGHGTLDRIASSIQAAQADRAPAQRFVDQFASIYTPVVFVVALATATAPVALGYGSLRDWLYRALVLLVLACPCALVISTPVTVVAGLGGAARRGILIKGGVHLEQARRVRILALDKTGTLTHGRPAVTDIHPVDPSLTIDDVVQLAASIEGASEHPVARAVTSAWHGAHLPIGEFEALPGRGVVATVEGHRYWLGNHRLVEDRGQCNPDLEAVLERYERDATTAVVLMTDTSPIGVLAIADTIRAETPDAIAQLRKLGIEPVMLTGDNGHTARAVARRVGITEVHGDLLPDDKLRLISELAARGTVAMVGDGINDAPALAKANVGIAMGAAGTDTAIETADVALMDDDPRKLAELIRISQHTTHVLWQNITFAIAVKAIFFGLTFAGIASLWLAVLADMGASLIVIVNGLRLLTRPSHTRRDHGDDVPAPTAAPAVAVSTRREGAQGSGGATKSSRRSTAPTSSGRRSA